MCVYDEAIKEYKLILEMQPDYVPALKGLFLCSDQIMNIFLLLGMLKNRLGSISAARFGRGLIS